MSGIKDATACFGFRLPRAQSAEQSSTGGWNGGGAVRAFRSSQGFDSRPARPTTVVASNGHDLPDRTQSLKQQSLEALPNAISLANITDLPTGEGWFYLVALLISLPARSSACLRAGTFGPKRLRRSDSGQRQRPGARLVCHSGRGSHNAAHV